MNKKVISILFSVAFLLFIALPTILAIVDNTAIVSMQFSVSEEEKKDGEKNIEILLSNLQTKGSDCDFISTECNSIVYFNNYSKPHLNINSPPPELHLL